MFDPAGLSLLKWWKMWSILIRGAQFCSVLFSFFFTRLRWCFLHPDNKGLYCRLVRKLQTSNCFVVVVFYPVIAAWSAAWCLPAVVWVWKCEFPPTSILSAFSPRGRCWAKESGAAACFCVSSKSLGFTQDSKLKKQPLFNGIIYGQPKLRSFYKIYTFIYGGKITFSSF